MGIDDIVHRKLSGRLAWAETGRESIALLALALDERSQESGSPLSRAAFLPFFAIAQAALLTCRPCIIPYQPTLTPMPPDA